MWLKTAAAGALLAIGWGALRWFSPPLPVISQTAQLELQGRPVLIFAPHSDDEVLAAGGLLQAAAERGADPHVVVVTGGDAFKVAAEAHYLTLRVGSGEMLSFGRHRLGESRAALAALGLPAERLTFLGYPDQGLHKLWKGCWRETNPCTGYLTGARAVPYSEARTPGAPYAGQRLMQDLKAVLLQTRPGLVVYPHPNEAHVDHWALSNFVTAALAELRWTEPGWEPPEEWLYLVHRGDWPAPKGYWPDEALMPPAKMPSDMTTWFIQPLTAEQVRRKAEALEQFRSQTRISRRYLFSFVRANELFGRLNPPQPAGAAGLGPVNGPPWAGPNWLRVIADPRGDTVARQVQRSADVVALWVATGGPDLHLAAEMAAPLRRPAEARLYVRGFQAGVGWGDVAEVSGNTQVKGNWLRTSVPLAVLGDPDAVMVGVETRTESVLIDRSAWRLLPLNGR